MKRVFSSDSPDTLRGQTNVGNLFYLDYTNNEHDSREEKS